MALNRQHTMTMFRDNADTNAVFRQESVNGVSTFIVDKVNEETDEIKTILKLSNDGFILLKAWAEEVDPKKLMEIVLSGFEDEYQLKLAPSAADSGTLRFVKCAPGGKKKTVLVLDTHQTTRFVSWLNRTKS